MSSPVLSTRPMSPLAASLTDSVEAMTAELVDRIATADPSYAQTGLLTEDQLHHTCLENLTAMVEALSGNGPLRLRSAREAGRLKAEQGIPVSSLLHAYRLGGRLVWEELTSRSGGPGDPRLHDLATGLWELVDLFSDAAVESYRETEVLLAHSDAQTQSRLVRTLFDDHTNPARVLDILRTLGISEGGAFTVVVIDSELPAPLPAELSTALRDAGIRSVWDAQIDAHVGLLAAATTAAIDRVPAMLGAYLCDRVGVSTTFAAPHGISAAMAEARLSCRSARPGSAATVRFGEEPVAHLLVAVPEAGRAAAAHILGPVLRLPAAERDDLVEVLEVWFRCGGSAAAVAETMHCHRNTVRYRLRKVRDLTGRDTTDPRQSAELYLALEAFALLGDGAGKHETRADGAGFAGFSAPRWRERSAPAGPSGPGRSRTRHAALHPGT
ncbi:PucR family transcriptional regulator [Nocardia vermiculata]|uniref:PucR family transcriptional regulator n=1 Tax=Nocardia vermiculata TaxID=257274 RepID=A0A846Y187_9NOCA|nr:PucR family transcriptional regulator [Nocardia vermiculata]NKY53033.1 PucR family transcriptional regulator [Nocardia vermiculata]